MLFLKLPKRLKCPKAEFKKSWEVRGGCSLDLLMCGTLVFLFKGERIKERDNVQNALGHVGTEMGSDRWMFIGVCLCLGCCFLCLCPKIV
jgi:hypothetical protein